MSVWDFIIERKALTTSDAINLHIIRINKTTLKVSNKFRKTFGNNCDKEMIIRKIEISKVQKNLVFTNKHFTKNLGQIKI